MYRSIKAAMLAAAFGCWAAAAGADEPAESDGWQFQFTGYGWLTALNGKTGVGGREPVDVDISASELLKNLDGALMGSLFAKKDEWLIMTDVIWAKLSDKESNESGRATLKFEQTEIIASAALGYELPLGVPDLEVSATAGFRYTRLWAKAQLSVDDGRFYGEREGVQAWTDPTIGVFVHYELSDSWYLNGLADVGGFGLGSKVSTQGLATIGYLWNDSISTAVGYRVIYMDYENNGFVYDAAMYGPMIGIGVRF